MKIRLNEDYYNLCCDWCDSETQVFWTRILDGAYCGACHRPIKLEGTDLLVPQSTIAAGLC